MATLDPATTRTQTSFKDPLSAGADLVAEGMTAPTTRLTFLAAEGAGDHCEMGSRALYDLRAYDWLADVFGG